MQNNTAQLSLIKELIANGIVCLEENKKSINAINIFPTDNKDTGDNLYKTLKFSFDSTKDINNLPEFLTKFSAELTQNARGISGIILATIMYSIIEYFAGEGEISLNKLPNALEKACNDAFTYVRHSIINPDATGTILTVFEQAVLDVNTHTYNTLEEFFDSFASSLNQAVIHTKYEMKILEENDVVDAGALGLLHLVYGMKRTFNKKQKTSVLQVSDGAAFFDMDISFIKQEKYDENSLRKALSSLGENLILQNNNDIIKVNIRSYWPGMILNLCQGVGTLINVQINKVI